jgi:hypothetical protein
MYTPGFAGIDRKRSSNFVLGAELIAKTFYRGSPTRHSERRTHSSAEEHHSAKESGVGQTLDSSQRLSTDTAGQVDTCDPVIRCAAGNPL